MASAEQFAEAKFSHEVIVSTARIEPVALLESLKRVLQVGEAAAQNDEIGTVRFANETTALFTGALALNEAGKVQPPLSEKQVGRIHEQIERLSVFTQGNEETGPTDTLHKPTSNKK